MEYEKIKQLMDDMGDSKLTNIEIEFPDGTKICMKKEAKETVQVNQIAENNVVASNATTQQQELIKEVVEEKGNIVKSPMVGTFYTKPSPTSNPYVEIGKNVKVGDTLCIIEAMKLMNEIESEFAGKITEVFVKDGESVEYGAPLFKIN